MVDTILFFFAFCGLLILTTFVGTLIGMAIAILLDSIFGIMLDWFD